MKLLISIFFIALSLIACNKGQPIPQSPTKWKGTFSGSTGYGSLELQISPGNTITGTLTTSSSFTSAIDGQVTTGNKVSFTAGSTTTGSIYEGNISDNTISGKWKFYNNTDNGTWIVYRP